MLKKILFNKFEILDIPPNLPINSEEFIKILFTAKNVVMFNYDVKDDNDRVIGRELRLARYTGYQPDWLGRATRYQPIAVAGGEVYPTLTLADCVKYNENPLNSTGEFGSDGYVIDDINNYIYILQSLDNALVINAKQIYMPFIAKVAGTDKADKLRAFMKKVFGKGFESLIIDISLKDLQGGTSIETTNMQLFLEQIQNAKKKLLDEAFLYLGVSSPEGKLAHQSELEIQEASKVTDIIDFVMYNKFVDFVNRCNTKFGTTMRVIKRSI